MQNENGVLAVQEDFGNALVDKYTPVWDKKYRSKGESIWVFQRRTLSSACQVATTLHDVNNPVYNRRTGLGGVVDQDLIGVLPAF